MKGRDIEKSREVPSTPNCLETIEIIDEIRTT